MNPFTISDITNLENTKSRESLGSKIGLMIMNSATVEARVEEITFDTGEYAVVLRGVLEAPRVGENLSETQPLRLGDPMSD